MPHSAKQVETSFKTSCILIKIIIIPTITWNNQNNILTTENKPVYFFTCNHVCTMYISKKLEELVRF
jgi:hypothetical protein